MKKNVFRIAAVVITLGWMALIFGFSAQSGEESGGLSALIAQPITDAIAAWKGLDDTEALYQQVDHIVRSTAHFSEYAILGSLLTMALNRFGLQWRWLPWVIGVVYAILDEWHQSYSPGRVCDPVDVLIDACGVFAGVFLTYYLTKIWRKKHVYHQ